MLTQKGNIHNHKIPQLGSVGYLSFGINNWGEMRYKDGRKMKYQVIAFPLCDNVLPHSIGIHTAYFKNLQNGKLIKASGIWFFSID